MKRTRITLDPDQFPVDVAVFLDGAEIFDSSCSEEAHVYFIDRVQGIFLKVVAIEYLAWLTKTGVVAL